MSPGDGAPCRHCLEDGMPGEEVVLGSHSPFTGDGPYNERGPVFVHAHDCARHAPASEVPPIVARRLVVVRAYSAREEIIGAELTEGKDAPKVIESLLENKEAAFLHVRTARYGCYLCRVERGPAAVAKG